MVWLWSSPPSAKPQSFQRFVVDQSASCTHLADCRTRVHAMASYSSRCHLNPTLRSAVVVGDISLHLFCKRCSAIHTKWTFAPFCCFSFALCPYILPGFVAEQDDYVVSASLDQTVRVWDTTGLRKKTVRGAPSAMVSCVCACLIPISNLHSVC